MSERFNDLSKVEAIRDSLFPMMQIDDVGDGFYDLILCRTTWNKGVATHQELVFHSLSEGNIIEFNDDSETISDRVLDYYDIRGNAYQEFVGG